MSARVAVVGRKNGGCDCFSSSACKIFRAALQLVGEDAREPIVCDALNQTDKYYIRATTSPPHPPPHHPQTCSVAVNIITQAQTSFTCVPKHHGTNCSPAVLLKHRVIKRNVPGAHTTRALTRLRVRRPARVHMPAHKREEVFTLQRKRVSVEVEVENCDA